MTFIGRLTCRKEMKKETNNRSLFHLFSRRSLINENDDRRYSYDTINRTTSYYSSCQKPIPNNMINNNRSQTSTLAKFCYKKMCRICIPQSIRIDKSKKQQIDLDLLYAYDPFQIEVGDITNSFKGKYFY